MHRPLCSDRLPLCSDRLVSVKYRSSIDQVSAKYRPSIGPVSMDLRLYRSTYLSVDYRSTIGRLSVDCRPIYRPIYRPSPPIVHKIRRYYEDKFSRAFFTPLFQHSSSFSRLSRFEFLNLLRRNFLISQ